MCQARDLPATRIEKILGQGRVHGELQHLMNRPIARFVSDVPDAGAMCRDSALVVGMLVARLGMPVSICEGQAAVFAPAEEGPYVELHFETHAWVDVPGYGVCDFSIDLRRGHGPGWATLPATHLCGSRHRPGGKPMFDYVNGDAWAFEKLRESRESEKPLFHALYLEERRAVLDPYLIADSLNFTRSPLTEDLKKKPFFSGDILVKAGLHLWRLAKGRAKSLASFPQEVAWERIGGTTSSKAASFVRAMKLSAQV